MGSARLAIPRQCPNCGVVKKGFEIAPDWKQVKELIVSDSDFDCPKCRGSFCSNCFNPDFQGNGNAFRCPHCLVLLLIPSPEPYRPDLSN